MVMRQNVLIKLQKCMILIIQIHLIFKNRLGGIHLFEQSKRIENLLQYQRFDHIAAAIQEKYEDFDNFLG